MVKTFLLAIFLLPYGLLAQELNPYFYDLGSPTVTDYYIDYQNGNDSNSGLGPNSAFRTLTQAWNLIPQNSNLTNSGFRINIMPGTLPESSIPNYWENRFGTFNFPIIIQSYSTTATLQGDVNMFNSKYVYFININITPEPTGDTFHCEQCSYVLLRGLTLNGRDGAHETVKINQSDHVYIENSNISGAGDNAIDFVSVQYGHIVGSRIHNAGDWCVYVKGGSAYLRLSGNVIFNCGTGGFVAGQGTGLEFMRSPWLHYEAYDIKFINNIIHNTEGAGMGVNGGYNVLLAHNTIYEVGERSHIFESVFGLRSCDGDSSACANRIASGGWGTSTIGSEEYIPNKNVFVFNNVFSNPDGYQSQWQHLAVYDARIPSGGSNIPNPARVDENLVIKGNIIKNGNSSMPLGVGDGEGCESSNATCNASQLATDNSINDLIPVFQNTASEDFRPTSGGVIVTYPKENIPNFLGGDRIAPPLAPVGNLNNEVPYDFSGNTRTSTTAIGVYHSSSSALNRSLPEGFPVTPQDPDGTEIIDSVRPRIRGLRVRVRENDGFLIVRVMRVRITDNFGVISLARARILASNRSRYRNLREYQSDLYRGKAKLLATKPLTLRIVAKDPSNNRRTLRKVYR